MEDLAKDETFATYRSIMAKFLDTPAAPYSIHNIAQKGVAYGKKIGEWFGPSTIALVLS